MAILAGATWAMGSAAAAAAPARVGAIRWDAWHGEHGGPGQAVQEALTPEQWRSRLPFFAEVAADGKVRIDGTAQAVMDRELAYAHAAGIAYWAFVTYPPSDAMSIGLERYLASPQRHLVSFCLITEAPRWTDPAYVERLAKLMAEPGYLTVLEGRPVLYLGFLTDELVAKRWGGAAGLRALVDGLRAAVRRQGQANPYIVLMDFRAERGHRWLTELGLDALSSYAAQANGVAAPYTTLAAHAERFWSDCQATGAQVVPIAMAGWDRRPRVLRPMPWETWQQPGAGIEKYYQSPTPAELAAHVQRAVRWVAERPQAAPAGLVIIYAWNENDEGGWLVPSLTAGPARLAALAPILRPGPVPALLTPPAP
jgi:hypothetical protein